MVEIGLEGAGARGSTGGTAARKAIVDFTCDSVGALGDIQQIPLGIARETWFSGSERCSI